MRVNVAVVLLAMGCTSAPRQVVGNKALLQSVSNNQAWVAYLSHDVTNPNGTHAGRLAVAPIAGGATVTLDDNATAGTFSRGQSLWFLGGVSTVMEGAPLLPRYYGALELWLPGLTGAIKVGSVVRDFSPSLDGSTVVYMDFESPSQAAKGKLMAVSSSTCGTGSCQPLLLADGILVTQASWRVSDDGKYVMATIRGANQGDPGAAILAQPATGDMQLLSVAPGTRSAMMTPTGDAVAWVEGLSKIMTASPTRGPSLLVLTTGQTIDAAAMLDAQNYVAKVRTVSPTGAVGVAALARLTAAGAASLGVQHPFELFVSQYVPGTTTNYVFYSTMADTTATGTTDLWLLDVNKAATPVKLSDSAATVLPDNLQFSDDGSTLRWLDRFDPTTRLADLYVSPLTSPTRTLAASGVRQGAFEPGSTRLLYVNAPDATSGAGVLTLLPSLGKPTLVEGVGLVNFQDTRVAPPRTFYTQRTGGSGDGIWYTPTP